MDLSVLIPARNERFLKRTIEDVLAHAKAETEVIAVLDGEWADPPLPDLPRLRVTHSASVIGQRAATNLAARMSAARYVMKLDAHCSVAEGFDVALIKADEEIGRPDITQIPAMYNLHGFNWRCQACGTETYQGQTPITCAVCAASGRSSGSFEEVVYWDLNAGGVPGSPRRTEFWRFDHDLHFQYGGPRRPDQRHDELADVMSSVGACFFMRRERFEQLGGLDEAHGSWGQFGTEIACKSWLSGGRQVVNRRTWFAHLFRTQGGDFSFPYPMSGTAQERAREHSRKLWLENTWPGQTRPLSWLIEHFAPIKGWHDAIGSSRLSAVSAAGNRFQRAVGVGASAAGVGVKVSADTAPTANATRLSRAIVGGNSPVVESQLDAERPEGLQSGQHRRDHTPSRGIVYYSDCRPDRRILEAAQRTIEQSGMPIVAVTLAPIAWPAARNIVFEAERGYLTMFRQILAGLEAIDTDVVFFCEHDVLYHQSHFEFTPPRNDTFYFNQNTWRVDAETGRALFYYCNQVSGLSADRQLLLQHYRNRVAHVEAHGFSRNIGFEPGCNSRVRKEIDPHGAESWMAAYPNVDIKTRYCLTPGRWSQDQFRNKNSCSGWAESDHVPSWGHTLGRFYDFLAEIDQRKVA